MALSELAVSLASCDALTDLYSCIKHSVQDLRAIAFVPSLYPARSCEIDGNHHYSDLDGRSTPRLYAELMGADRALRLVGYEVYRFGAHKLQQSNAEEVLIGFYRSLFAHYSLITTP
ncbi:hypothetical protein JOE34_004813 [Pseudomonas sp. PvP028]|jgi:hypothetical protein|nr:hypothetical protein [Pseudomonas sp. PvP028]